MPGGRLGPEPTTIQAPVAQRKSRQHIRSGLSRVRILPGVRVYQPGLVDRGGEGYPPTSLTSPPITKGAISDPPDAPNPV